MKNNTTRGFVITLLMIISFVLGVFVDDLTKPSKAKTLAMLLSYPDGSFCENPCLLGIQPGTTTVEQAKEILNLHKLTKGGVIVSNDYSGKSYLDIALQNNGLRIEVDYEKGLVLEVSLDGSFVRGLGYAGVIINGYKFTIEDIQPYIGVPQKITASSGDGGIISQVVAFYEGNWCVYPSDFEQETMMQYYISPDAYIEEISINCYWLRLNE